MVALVEILNERGAIITGSDVSERFYTDDILDKLHICALPFSADNITNKIQYVIYSAAYNPQKTPDLVAALSKKIPCMLYTEALGSISEKAYSCGICGVHGKTSTTGLTGTILDQLDLPVQVLAGSVINSFGNSCTITTKNFMTEEHSIFVAETCEYQRHFMAFCPQKIVLTSVESDHQDYYPTYEDIRNAFVDYACKLPENGELIYCADDKGAVEAAGMAKKRRNDIVLIPYGEQAHGDYHLTFGSVKNEIQTFTLQLTGELSLRVPGRHEVRDAAAATALVCELLRTNGKNPEQYADKIHTGLLNFTGGKRRSETIGRAQANGNSVIFIDDYGHHPTAIKTTLAGYRAFYRNRKIIIDFMSHTYTRTAALLDDFAQSFSDADEVILHKIYGSAREDASAAHVTGETLFEQTKKYHKNVHYYKEILDAKDFVISELSTVPEPRYSDGYLFVTMGAGDNWKIGQAVCDTLNGVTK